MPVNQLTRTSLEIDGQPVPLVARVNRRAKRLILKIDPVAGEIHVTAPSKRSVPEAIAFAHERKEWIAGQLDDRLRAQPFRMGSHAPYKGERYKIILEGTPRAPIRILREPPPSITVGGDEAHLNRRLVDWMKRQARAEMTRRVDNYCTALGKTRRAVRIRDTRTRWGSCSSDGVISFSWRLIMAPPDIQDYVAAHECTHLAHMNHSPAFWRQVAALGVSPRAAENWFELHGAELFKYGVAER